jgi:hypothetical protein
MSVTATFRRWIARLLEALNSHERADAWQPPKPPPERIDGLRREVRLPGRD